LSEYVDVDLDQRKIEKYDKKVEPGEIVDFVDNSIQTSCSAFV